MGLEGSNNEGPGTNRGTKERNVLTDRTGSGIGDGTRWQSSCLGVGRRDVWRAISPEAVMAQGRVEAVELEVPRLLGGPKGLECDGRGSREPVNGVGGRRDKSQTDRGWWVMPEAWHEPERIERSENVKVGRRRREFSGVESVVRLSSGQANVWSESPGWEKETQSMSGMRT